MFVYRTSLQKVHRSDIRHDLLVVEIILLPKTILARQLLRIVSISHFGDWAYCPAAIREQKITLGHLRVGWYLEALKSVFHGFICPFRGYVPFSDISSPVFTVILS
jgi:hypothetical protein